MNVSWQILEGDCREQLATLDAGSVQSCITSPPYFGLRDYGTGEWEGGDSTCDHLKVSDKVAAVATSTLGGGKKTTGHVQERFGATCGKCGARRVDRQIGLEPTPDEFVTALVEVFREVRRVLRDDGTVWLNLGDSFHGGGYSNHRINGDEWLQAHGGDRRRSRQQDRIRANPGLKPKDLIGIPWMVAFALRADGWYLRSEIIWAKRNCMPESVTDRPTRAHEQIFLLSKKPRYFYDSQAIREESDPDQAAHDQQYAKVYDGPGTDPANGQPGNVNNGGIHSRAATDGKSNKRSVWRVASTPFPGAHFATYPPKLIEPCILAGSREGDTVLDPFAGSGTTGMVALRHGRSFVGCELNHEYVELARRRITDDAPLFNHVTEAA